MKCNQNRKTVAGRALLLLCSLWCALSAMAQVTVDVTIDSLELLVGEQTRIRLEVSCDAKTKLVLPPLKKGDLLVPGVELVEVAKTDTQSLNEGKRRLFTQDYIITSFDSAFYYLPPFVVKADGKAYESKNLALRVLTIPVDTVHLDRFCGPKDIVDAPFSWEDWRPILLLSLLLLVWMLLVLYVYIRFRDNKPVIKLIKFVPKLLPHAKAMQEIDQIKAERVWAKEDSKEYYVRLTATLRTYIESRFGFNAMEMTSNEIIERLLKEPSGEMLDELRELFRTADLVKFAKYNTRINENDMNLVNAIEFINQTKVEADPNAKPVPDEEVVEQKRSRRVILSMRATLVVCSLLGLFLLGWILWLIKDLIA